MDEETFELLMDYIDERISKFADEDGADFRDWEIRSKLKEKLVF